MFGRGKRFEFLCALVLLLSFRQAHGTAAKGSPGCQAPPALETTIQSRHDERSYAELGNWFGERRRFDCAVSVYGDGLKRHPQSALLNYLL